MEIKTHIRKEILSKRAAMTNEEVIGKSNAIISRLMDMKAYQDAKDILVYVDFQNEVITKDFIVKAILQGKNIFCPVIKNNEMDFYKINNLDDLESGYFGILEPRTCHDMQKYKPQNQIASNYQTNTLMIMPGVAFDDKKDRIGYGKGYYDRYLATHSAFYVIAICFEIQIIENIEAQAHDRRPDMLLTEERCIF